MATAKQRAHDLIERLSPTQLTAVVRSLEAMLDPAVLDPAARAIPNAPLDDQSESQRARVKFQESQIWFKRSGGELISREDYFQLCPRPAVHPQPHPDAPLKAAAKR